METVFSFTIFIVTIFSLHGIHLRTHLFDIFRPARFCEAEIFMFKKIVNMADIQHFVNYV